MFANEFLVPKVHRDARAVAIPAGEFLRGRRGPIPANEADGNHAARVACLRHFIVVKVEKGLVGVDQRDVLPAIAIVVQHREAAAVRRIIQSREAGDVREGSAAPVREVMVALVAVERMDQDFVAHPIDPGQTQVNLRTEIVGRRGAFPLGREPEGLAREVIVRAHHGPPEIAFEIQFGGELLWRGEVTAEHIQIEEAVVVEIDEASAPGPPGVHHRHRGRGQTGDLFEFAVGLFLVEPVPGSGFNEHLVQPRDSGGHAATGIAIHIRDVEVFAAVIVVVPPGSAHAVAVIIQLRLGRHIREAGGSVVAKQDARGPIVGHEKVRPAVLIVIAPGGLKRIAPQTDGVVLGCRFETSTATIDE